MKSSLDPVIDTRVPLPYPEGWFAACYSHELQPGAVLTVPFMGEELVVYRTRAGLARAVDPYCPHLGAHLGHGGKLEGEDLVCPFHGLAFGPDGRCVRALGGRTPPAATLTQRHLRERRGMLLVWRDSAGRPPSWEVPDLDLHGFSQPQGSTFTLRGYAQDMVENTADPLHFAAVHGFTDVSMAHQMVESWLKTVLTGRWHGVWIRIQVTCYGIGHVLGESDVPSLGVDIKTIAFATQTTPLTWIFRWADVVRISRLDAWPSPLQRMAYAALVRAAHGWFVRVVASDFPIWEKRRYLERPKLIVGEAALAAFRRWSAQFYPGAASADARSFARPGDVHPAGTSVGEYAEERR